MITKDATQLSQAIACLRILDATQQQIEKIFISNQAHWEVIGPQIPGYQRTQSEKYLVQTLIQPY